MPGRTAGGEGPLAEASLLSDAALEAALTDAGIPFCPVFDGMTLANDAYFQARGDVVRAVAPGVGPIATPGSVHADRGRPFHPPTLGEATREVLSTMLGLEPAEITRLAEAGTI